MSAEPLPIEIVSRRCYHCGTRQPLTAFPVSLDRPLGRAYRCKPCAAAYHRDRYQQQVAADPAFRQRSSATRCAAARRQRATETAYRAAHPDEERACDRCGQRHPFSAFKGAGTLCADCRATSHRAARIESARQTRAARPPRTEKPCPRCGETLPLDRFRQRPLPSGGTRIESDCRACEVARNHDRYRRLYGTDPDFTATWKRIQNESYRRRAEYRNAHPDEPRACRVCGETKRLIEFYVGMATCIACRKAQKQAREEAKP